MVSWHFALAERLTALKQADNLLVRLYDSLEDSRFGGTAWMESPMPNGVWIRHMSGHTKESVRAPYTEEFKIKEMETPFLINTLGNFNKRILFSKEFCKTTPDDVRKQMCSAKLRSIQKYVELEKELISRLKKGVFLSDFFPAAKSHMVRIVNQ